MSDDDEKGNPGDLVRVKVGPSGVDVAASNKWPELISKVLPVRWVGKRNIERAVMDRIQRKIEGDEPFDDAEREFAEAMLGDRFAQFVRLKQIQARAVELTAVDVQQLPGGTGNAEARDVRGSAAETTSDDWVNKFREDAGLVGEAQVQEVYARILAGESARPGSVSLRTLGVLRYLDKAIAEHFSKLMQVTIDGSFIPGQDTPWGRAVLERAGLSHDVLNLLDDAGLVNGATLSNMLYEEKPTHVWILTGHGIAVAGTKEDGTPFSVALTVHMLKQAGRELARIADCNADPTVERELIAWIRPRGGGNVSTARFPNRRWTGDLRKLTWAESKG